MIGRPKILVTHFDPFGQDSLNVSREVAALLSPDLDLVVKEIKTSRKDVDERVPRLLHDVEPDAVLAMGQALGRTRPSLEWIGVNLIHSSMPDNRQETHSAAPIIPDGPAAYFASLPLLRLEHTLNKEGLPVGLSSSAGLFMCNQALYLFSHYGQGIPVGFLHLPSLPEQGMLHPQRPTMSLELQVRIVTRILQDIKDWLVEGQPRWEGHP